MSTEWSNNTSGLAFIKCNGQSYNADGLSGDALFNKIQEVRRANNIEVFDVIDSTSAKVSVGDVKTGNFQGDLSIVRFNKAA